MRSINLVFRIILFIFSLSQKTTKRFCEQVKYNIIIISQTRIIVRRKDVLSCVLLSASMAACATPSHGDSFSNLHASMHILLWAIKEK